MNSVSNSASAQELFEETELHRPESGFREEYRPTLLLLCRLVISQIFFLLVLVPILLLPCAFREVFAVDSFYGRCSPCVSDSTAGDVFSTLHRGHGDRVYDKF